MAEIHPTRTVQFQLLTTLLGVSLPFTAELVVKKHEPYVIVAASAFFLTALNFYHGKVVALQDEEYNLSLLNRPGLALADYVFNIWIVMCFVFEGFFIDKPIALLLTNLMLRLVDTALVSMVRRVSTNPEVRRAQEIWLGFDLFSIVYFGALLAISCISQLDKMFVSAAYLALIIVDLAVDYYFNRKFYFAIPDDWDDVAAYWDAMQGAWGDKYRQYIILPNIISRLPAGPIGRVLDLGCGNGCVARAISSQGGHVIGIDSSDTMLQLARQYTPLTVRYQRADITSRPQVIDGGNFALIIACFSFQDCGTLEHPMGWVACNLAAGGRAVLVFELDASLDRLDVHQETERRWIDPPAAVHGRRQLVIWPRTHASPDELSRAYRTITRHWSPEEYRRKAQLSGLFVTDEVIPLKAAGDTPTSVDLRSYYSSPRFGMLVLASQPAPRSALAVPAPGQPYAAGAGQQGA